MNELRPTNEDVFMAMAFLVSTRSTCARRSVGSVIVDEDNRVLSTGYNGVASGQPHCTQHPCPAAKAKSGERIDECYALHAEQNAVTSCSQIARAHTIFTTTMPCISCLKLLIATPISRIMYYEDYPSINQAVFMWESLGREIVHAKSIEEESGPAPLIHASILMGAPIVVAELEGSKKTCH